MSMLSAQCDNLRMMARLVLDYEPKEVRRALREAADTIWRLRTQLHTQQTEEERLNEQVCELQEKIADLWPRAAYTMGKSCKEQWIEDLRELGVEVEDDEHSEY